jgi:hypothetical protein
VKASGIAKGSMMRTLSDLGTRDCTHGILLLGYGMGSGPYLTSVVTIPNVVGLLVH